MIKCNIEISEETYEKLEIMSSLYSYNGISRSIEELTTHLDLPSAEEVEEGRTMSRIGNTFHIKGSEVQSDWLVAGYYSSDIMSKLMSKEIVEKIENGELSDSEIDDLYNEVSQKFDGILESEEFQRSKKDIL